MEPVARPEVGREARVLTEAVVRAMRGLGVSQRTLAGALGVSEASVSRLGRSRSVDPASKEGELAVLFVRLYRSLDTLVGGDETRARTWMHAHNHHLGGVPVEQIRSVTGLVQAVEYLDAMRGKS
jgi:hypothetical protein